MEANYPLIILAVIVIVLIKRDSILKFFFKHRDTNQVDYSFGLKVAREIRKQILAKKFVEAETTVLSLPPDELVVVLDYVGLSVPETHLLDWEKATGSDIVELFLGVFYNHQAWIARTHGFAKDVSVERQMGFVEYQKKSEERLLRVNLPEIQTEADSRLIRVFTGYGNVKEASNYFHRVVEKDREYLWAYIHYAEVIQPKWGGNLGLIDSLMKNLPSRPLIRQIVELKLILDSFTLSQNYFGGSMDDLTAIAKDALHRIDAEITSSPPSSIQRYVAFNYLTALSDQLSENGLKQKYFKKMKGYYTLYPYGINK